MYVCVCACVCTGASLLSWALSFNNELLLILRILRNRMVCVNHYKLLDVCIDDVRDWCTLTSNSCLCLLNFFSYSDFKLSICRHCVLWSRQPSQINTITPQCIELPSAVQCSQVTTLTLSCTSVHSSSSSGSWAKLISEFIVD